MSGNLFVFLALVRDGVREPNNYVWGEQIRKSLSENFVKIGWGGAYELTDAGRTALRDHAAADKGEE